MSERYPQPTGPLPGPAAWRGEQLVRADDWIHVWTPAQTTELEQALRTVRSRSLLDLRPGDVPLPSVGPLVDRWRRELLHGRGFVVLRGLDVDRYARDEIATIFWVLGLRLGRPLPQNAMGHLLGHVVDLGRDAADPTARIYQTNERQGYHTDSADFVGLLCLESAATGGRSALASCAALYNELLLHAPEALTELFHPLCTDHRGEAPPGRPPFFTAPVFSWFAGELSVLYQRRYIESAQRFDGVPALRSQQLAALDALDRAADDPTVHLEMDLQPGDIQFIHNHQLLHDRTAFRDEPHRRRHLLRLWLCPDDGRPLPPWFAERLLSVEPGMRGGVSLDGVEPCVELEP